MAGAPSDNAEQVPAPPGGTDFLTGFLPRSVFSQVFRRELAAASREGGHLSIILIDIDHFKTVNDGFGHSRGDQVLREFSRRLGRALRGSDLVFRYGGDEFVVMLPGTPVPGARRVASNIMEKVTSARFAGEPELSVTISMGIASFPADGSAPEDIFEKADARLYQAKRQGRGRVAHADEEGGRSGAAEDGCRLLERDSELAVARGFLRELPARGHGVLVITGPPRSGKDDLVEAIACSARLSGMEVLRVDPFALAQGLGLAAPPRDGGGLLMVLDGAGHLGEADLRAVRSCVTEHPGKVAVLLTGTDLTSDGWGMVASFPLSEVIHLGPVSFAALRIWLRSATGAEPSREFAGWFYSETGGLPGNFGPALRYLERRGYVERAGGVLTPSVRYWEYDLSRELSFEAGYRVRNLPTGFATSFVGRRATTSSIIDHLRSGRSVCITGPGGSGKTRTALNAASLIEDEFRNGVCFVALSGTPMRETILSALVAALDLRTADGGDPLAQLRAFLADKEMLIILDGDDGADDPAGVIDAVRAAAPAIRFLVTSRARPAIAALEEVELGGLSVPAGRLDAEGTESVELFLQVARRVRSGFQPDEDDIGEIAAICRAVDGLPLALELSASLMDGLPPAGIRRNVERDLLSLASDDGAIPERHRSMEAVFRQSWNLVPPSQQAILRKLSVFRGVITPEAATAVAGADDGLLSRLQHRWMVRRTARGRWLLPRMIRSFLEKVLLSVPSEHDAARDAHLAFFAGYLSQMEESLFTMVDWTINRRELDGAFDDIRHAWEWALARGRSGSLRQMLKPLVLYFRSRGLYDAGIEMLGRTSGELASMEASTPGIASLVALTNVSLGLLLFLQGDLLEASRLVDDATSRPVAPDDPWTSGCILEYAGFIKFRSGEYSEAVDLLERGAGLFEAAGGRREYLQARADLGITLTAMGDVDRADAIVRETLEECRSAGFRRIEFACLQAAGGIAMARGEPEAARESYMMYLAFARENGLPAEIARTLNDLAGIAADMRDYDESEQLYRQAFKIYADFGNRNGQSGVDFNLGIVAQMRGRQDEAGEHYERTLKYAEETGERFLELGSHTGLSFVHGSRREWDQAIAHMVRAYDIATESGARPQALRALFGIAEVMEESGRLPEAARFLALCDGDPANDCENEDFLDKLRVRLSARLTPPEMAEAREDAARLGTALLDPLRLPAR